jgi:hypothetical protein
MIVSVNMEAAALVLSHISMDACAYLHPWEGCWHQRRRNMHASGNHSQQHYEFAYGDHPEHSVRG